MAEMQYMRAGDSTSDFSDTKDTGHSGWAAWNGPWAADMVGACMVGCWAAVVGVCSNSNGCNC